MRIARTSRRRDGRAGEGASPSGASGAWWPLPVAGWLSTTGGRSLVAGRRSPVVASGDRNWAAELLRSKVLSYALQVSDQLRSLRRAEALQRPFVDRAHDFHQWPFQFASGRR